MILEVIIVISNIISDGAWCVIVVYSARNYRRERSSARPYSVTFFPSSIFVLRCSLNLVYDEPFMKVNYRYYVIFRTVRWFVIFDCLNNLFLRSLYRCLFEPISAVFFIIVIFIIPACY